MARHRNVRTMNYDEDYEGYDDVYGHSMEDDYCVSPSVSQFIYNRDGSRAPQMSQFFSPEHNISEEPEDIENAAMEKTRERLDSLTIETAVQDAVADLVPEEEILLKSCLDGIRDVVGDSFPDNVVISHILNSKFNREKALDDLLSGISVDPSSLASNQPKKLKSAENPPSVGKPQLVKSKQGTSTSTGLCFYKCGKLDGGKFKNKLVENSIMNTVEYSVKSASPPENGDCKRPLPVSLLASLANVHLQNHVLNSVTRDQPNPLTANAVVNGHPSAPIETQLNNTAKTLLHSANPLLNLKSNGLSIGSGNGISISPPVSLPFPTASPSPMDLNFNLTTTVLPEETQKDSGLLNKGQSVPININPIINGANKFGVSLSSNPLLAAQNPILTPIRSPRTLQNGILSDSVDNNAAMNPLLSSNGIRLIPKISANTQQQPNSENDQKSVFTTENKPPPTPPVDPKPPILPLRYRKKRNTNGYQNRFTYPGRSEALMIPSSYLDVNTLGSCNFDSSLKKIEPSGLGRRFARKPLVSPNVVGSTHRQVWTEMAKIAVNMFLFNTPSPDALVGKASDFVGKRADADEAYKLAADENDNTKQNPILVDKVGNHHNNALEKVETKRFPGVKQIKNKRKTSNKNIRTQQQSQANITVNATHIKVDEQKNHVAKKTDSNITVNNSGLKNKKKRTRPKSKSKKFPDSNS